MTSESPSIIPSVIPSVVFTEIKAGGRHAARLDSCRAIIWTPTSCDIVTESEHLFDPPSTAGSRYIDPASRTTVAAARLLREDLPTVPPDRLACVLGTSTANAYSVAIHETRRLAGQRTGPLLFAHASWNVPVAMLAAELSSRGPSSTISDGPESGLSALDYAERILRRNRATAVVVGVNTIRLMSENAYSPDSIHSRCLLCALCLGQKALGFPPESLLQCLDPSESRLPAELQAFIDHLGSLDKATQL